MIKTSRFRVNIDRRGYITTGMKSERGLPTSLDHFDVSMFPEIAAAYGPKPNRLVVALPSNMVADFFDDQYGAWGKAPGGDPVLRRRCDGVACMHRIDETVAGITYARGEESDCVCEGLPQNDPQRCGYSAILKAFVVTPDGRTLLSPTCYGFKTGSINSGESIKSELMKMEFLQKLQNGGAATLAGLPLELSVRMVSGRDNAAQKFPIWSVQAFTFEAPSLPQAAPPAAVPVPTHGPEPLRIGASDQPAVRTLGTVAPTPDVEIVDEVAEEIDELGRYLYGESWFAKKRELALSVSKGRTGRITELDDAEKGRVFEGLEKRMVEQAPVKAA